MKSSIRQAFVRAGLAIVVSASVASAAVRHSGPTSPALPTAPISVASFGTPTTDPTTATTTTTVPSTRTVPSNIPGPVTEPLRPGPGAERGWDEDPVDPGYIDDPIQRELPPGTGNNNGNGSLSESEKRMINAIDSMPGLVNY